MNTPIDTRLAAVVAVDRRWAIGQGGGLLCHLPADLRRFKDLTMGHSIVMGRRTLESFPRGPLPGRQNIVITRNEHYRPQGVTVAHSVEQAVALATMPGEVFVIGGAQIYRAAMPLVTTLHLTVIDHEFEAADTFFPAIDLKQWHRVSEEHREADDRNSYSLDFITLKREI